MALRIRRLLAVMPIVLAPVLLAACSSSPAAGRHGSSAVSGDPLESKRTVHTLTQVQTDLGAVDNGLSQISSDLGNPQSDS